MSPSIFTAINHLRALMNRREKLRWLGIALFAVLTSFFEIITASTIVIFAQVLNQPETGLEYLSRAGLDTTGIQPVRAVLFFAALIGVVYLIKNMIAAVEVFYQNFSIQKMNYDFKNRLLSRYVNMDYGLFLTRNSSFGVNVVAGDAERVYSTGMLALAGILSETIVFTCLIAMIVVMNPSLALTMFAIGMVLTVIVAKILLPLFYRWGQRQQEAALYSNQNLYQFFHGFKEIVLMNKGGYFVDAYKEHSYRRSMVQAIQAAMNALPRMVIEVLFVGLFIGTIAFLCLRHESPAQMIGILGGYLYVGFRLMPGLNRIINHLNNFKSIISSIERLNEECHTITAEGNYIDVPEFVFNNYIALDNVSVRYPETQNDALQDISLKIPKGECLGIVGETGSGKSTLVDVLLGLLRPYQGAALVDGLYPLNSYQWHTDIGYVPQSVYLIDDTVEANIAFGEKQVDPNKLKNAIQAAQLEKFIEKLPQGIKTVVGERGVRISGGERQRISIARALYHEPEILIFDEATSALDNQTETQLMETIHAVSRNRTVIMIAHRLTTLRNCDRVVVMKNGRIDDITNYQTIAGLNKSYA